MAAKQATMLVPDGLSWDGSQLLVWASRIMLCLLSNLLASINSHH
jgi:hypothetical protein